MDQHGGVGDGRLQLGHGRDHLRCDGELLGGEGEGVRQGADDVGEAREETAVEVSHAEEALDVQLGGRRRELLDGGHLLREGADPLVIDYVAEEIDLGLVEDALLEVDGEVVGAEAGEDLSEVELVLLGGPAGDQDVIYINKYKWQIT